MGRRYKSLFSRAAAGQPGAHTNGPNCWKSQQLDRWYYCRALRDHCLVNFVTSASAAAESGLVTLY